jgi:hypothetical protein
MALLKGTNSYVTLAEANTYFENRLNVAAWTEASDPEKTQALITATSVLNDEKWGGMAISDSQLLAFPRSGSYFDPRLGHEVILSTSVPDRVITATYELAYHFLNNEDVLDDTGTVATIQVGTISLNIDSEANMIPASVKRLIRPLLVNSGTNIWWRAN